MDTARRITELEAVVAAQDAAINPREREASAAKISVAGLVGASFLGADGWRSQPGLIPQADEGVLVLQDAHAITQAQVGQLGPMLQELIEDGVVRDSKAGGLRRDASVGLLIDLNRVSQLDAQGTAASREAALARLRPLLSRLDLVAEIPADAKRAWRIGAQLGVAKALGSGDSRTNRGCAIFACSSQRSVIAMPL